MSTPSYQKNDPKGWCGDPSRGAAIGRHSLHTDSGSRSKYAGRIYLKRVRLDNGGYDENGTYYGISRGEELWWYSDGDKIDVTTRACHRDHAKRLVLAEYPNAWIPGNNGPANPVKEFLRRAAAGAAWEKHPGGCATSGPWGIYQFFSDEQKDEYLAGSETERYLLTDVDSGCEFVHFWESWSTNYPNTYYWGLSRGPLYYGIHLDGKELYRTKFKSHLLKAWKDKPWLIDA